MWRQHCVRTGGYWEISFPDLETTLSTIAGGVAFYGLGAGITEELVFRGVIMGCLEQRTNKYVAVLVPSVLFGMLHLIGNDLDIISAVQVVAAGSVVGILFSLITYENGSIWNSAVVHAVWNMVFVSGVLHIGSSADSSSICSFVLENKSFLISGGDFGIEASVISVMVYLSFCVIAWRCWKKRRNSLGRPISDW
ncbi:MAG TPA: CPBP family intramembrane metalloprotease [Candidatus Mediterraneibacter vanvlietii]|nr:CPBP family intramembrane metalloprotease [Candidatus Mediterraneibacter vanvlietii]